VKPNAVLRGSRYHASRASCVSPPGHGVAFQGLDMPSEGNKRSHNWKGGKTITSHGYVAVWVGSDHHLAIIGDGYAYEHRLVAEEKLGRRLRKGEIVHHVDGDKTNNDPENLAVLPGTSHHKLAHRKKESRLRKPGEINPTIKCGCGCGSTFTKYDNSGRPRKYLVGHCPYIQAPTMDAISKQLQDGTHTIDSLQEATGKTKTALRIALSKMTARGLAVRIKRGSYGPPGSTPWKNKLIQCACGCGAEFLERDKYGRARRFISGHNARSVGKDAD